MRLAWKIALAALAVAAAAALWRGMARPSAGELVAGAVEMLAADPVAWVDATRDAVRAAAAAALAEGDESAEACHVVAMQLQREGDIAGAEAWFRAAMAARPDGGWPYAALGSLIARDNPDRLGEAEEALRRAIELEPGWSRPHNSLAVALRLQGRLEEAEEEAVRAVELDPNDIAAQNNYANLLVHLGRLEDAEYHYLAALDLDPNHPKPYYNLACLYSLLGRDDEAMAMLEESVRRSGVMRQDAATDPDLDGLRNREDFMELIYGVSDVIPALPYTEGNGTPPEGDMTAEGETGVMPPPEAAPEDAAPADSPAAEEKGAVPPAATADETAPN